MKLSTSPLVNLLNFLEKKSIQRGILNDYHKFSSHPIYKERLESINFNKNKNNEFNFEKKINKQFNYIRAKLFGFTEKDEKIINQYLSNENAIYANAIVLSKKGKLKKSMKMINSLIKKNPNYIFLIETKADIIYANGFAREAILFYQLVKNKKPANHYVSKRIFDINFTLIEGKYLSKKLFDDYSYLLEIFYENKDLENKFKDIADTIGEDEWQNYFILKNRYNNKEIKIDIFNENLLKIKKNSINKILINLINKDIITK